MACRTHFHTLPARMKGLRNANAISFWIRRKPAFYSTRSHNHMQNVDDVDGQQANLFSEPEQPEQTLRMEHDTDQSDDYGHAAIGANVL